MNTNNMNKSRLIGSLVVVVLAIGGVFGFSVYKSKELKSEALKSEGQVGAVDAATQQQNTSAQNEILNPKSSNDGDDLFEDEDSDDVATTNSNTNNNTVQTPVADTTKKTYKDGTYTAIGSYNSPGGPDKISITLTLKNNIVTSVSAIPMAGDPKSEKYQQTFISGYQTFVVGKNIDTIKLTNVSGSSLTPIGFNDALEKIKVQAKA
jgi:uncharacterized protein with FMN-binding domain